MAVARTECRKQAFAYGWADILHSNNTSHTESTLVKPSHRHTLVSAIRVNPSQYESIRVSRVDPRRQRHHTALLVIRFTPQDAWAPKILQGALSQSESTRVDLSRFGST